MVLREMRLAAMKRDMAKNHGRTDLHKKLCSCPKCLSKLDEQEVAHGHLRLVTHNTAVAHHKRWDELFASKDPNELQAVPLFQPFFGLEPTAANISHVLHIFATRQGFPRGGRKRRFRSGSDSEGGDEHKRARNAVEAAAAAVSAAAAAAGHQAVPDASLSHEMYRLVENSQAQPWLYNELVKLFRTHGILLLDSPDERLNLLAEQVEQPPSPAPQPIQGEAANGQHYPYPYNGAPGVPPPPHGLDIFDQPAPSYDDAAPSLPHPTESVHAPPSPAPQPPAPEPAPAPVSAPAPTSASAPSDEAVAAAAAAAAAATGGEGHSDSFPAADAVPVPPHA